MLNVPSRSLQLKWLLKRCVLPKAEWLLKRCGLSSSAARGQSISGQVVVSP